ncbi:hypothetical protein HPO96_34685 [Kribbella sandramycini]|uniref:Small secreted protein n=1 Tax=Kribbella sandramycini TaxID=60450 RepID=A0A7Y4P3T6_9ACTN|nr:hypothetical protein [Kribbella sandramycini]MBB6570090.1 hypothetical protein [Kribbella sandramycini]NOL45408.1 hypothetical protein [Kribbella sandramycini]
MRKLGALAAALTMGAVALTACSGGDYCAELTSYAKSAKNLDAKNADQVGKALKEAEKVSKSAPSDLKDDWKTLTAYAKKAQDAKGDTAKLTELSKAEGQKMGEASAAIAKHAKDTCKIDLNNP